jgi:hypothetical protein
MNPFKTNELSDGRFGFSRSVLLIIALQYLANDRSATAQTNSIQACECACKIGSPSAVLCAKPWDWTSDNSWPVNCSGGYPTSPWCKFRWSCPDERFIMEQSGGNCPAAGTACSGYGHPLIYGTGAQAGYISSCKPIVVLCPGSVNGAVVAGAGSNVSDDFGKAAGKVMEEFCKSRGAR